MAYSSPMPLPLGMGAPGLLQPQQPWNARLGGLLSDNSDMLLGLAAGFFDKRQNNAVRFSDILGQAKQGSQLDQQRKAMNMTKDWLKRVHGLSEADAQVAIMNPVVLADFMKEPKPVDMPTSVEEYNYGITHPDYAQRQDELKLLGRNQTSVNMPPAESEFEKGYGGGMATDAIATVQGGDKAAINIQKTNLMSAMASDISTGKLAGPQATVGAWLKSVGTDPSFFGIDPNMPATAETVSALANSMILGKIGSQQGGFPANNFSEQDRNFLLTTIPQISDQPEAFAIKAEVSNRLDQLAIQRADEWQQARADGKSYETFSKEWRDKLSKMDVFGDLRSKVAQQGGVIDMGNGVTIRPLD